MEKSYNSRYKAKRRLGYIEYLGGKCVQCNSTENLEFDHIDPKTMSFRIASNIGRKDDVVKKELAKCQLLCKTCHRKKSNNELKNRVFIYKPIVHGKISTYTIQKCRCDKCKQGWRIYKRDYKRKKRDKELDHLKKTTIYSKIYSGNH